MTTDEQTKVRDSMTVTNDPYYYDDPDWIEPDEKSDEEPDDINWIGDLLDQDDDPVPPG